MYMYMAGKLTSCESWDKVLLVFISEGGGGAEDTVWGLEGFTGRLCLGRPRFPLPKYICT